ncbi:MAG TPA: hypothetical protein PLP33_24480 [Leptospiraceae bacterium]|nr:hypothetical protein [Leptospiraceae bacterium]
MYYKAVKVNNGKLVSAFIEAESAIIEYRVGEWAYPKIQHEDYGIFVSTKKNALETVSQALTVTEDGRLRDVFCSSLYEIYECEVVKSETVLKPWLSYTNYLMFQHDKLFFCPENTLIVKCCKLTRKLTKEELEEIAHEFHA